VPDRVFPWVRCFHLRIGASKPIILPPNAPQQHELGTATRTENFTLKATYWSVLFVSSMQQDRCFLTSSSHGNKSKETIIKPRPKKKHHQAISYEELTGNPELGGINPKQSTAHGAQRKTGE